MERIEAALRVVLDFHEAFKRGDVASMVQLLSDDCILENAQPAPDGAVYSGKEAAVTYYRELFQGARQGRMQIEEIFGVGFRCIMRWRYEWLDEAGKMYYTRGVAIFRLKGGLICEILSYGKA